MKKLNERHSRSLFIASIVFIVFMGAMISMLHMPNKQPLSAQTNERVQFPIDDYYPTFLPYTNPNAKHLSIILPNMTIDPTTYKPLSGSGFHNDYTAPQARLYMVQYKDSPDRSNMIPTPLKIFEHNTYIIQATPTQLKKILQDPEVNFIENYHPHYKIHPELLKAWYDNTITPKDKIAITFTLSITTNQIKNFLYTASGKEEPQEAYSKSADSQTYIVSGITERNKLFTYAMHPWITELQLIK